MQSHQDTKGRRNNLWRDEYDVLLIIGGHKSMVYLETLKAWSSSQLYSVSVDLEKMEAPGKERWVHVTPSKISGRKCSVSVVSVM